MGINVTKERKEKMTTYNSQVHKIHTQKTVYIPNVYERGSNVSENVPFKTSLS